MPCLRYRYSGTSARRSRGGRLSRSSMARSSRHIAPDCANAREINASGSRNWGHPLFRETYFAKENLLLGAPGAHSFVRVGLSLHFFQFVSHRLPERVYPSLCSLCFGWITRVERNDVVSQQLLDLAIRFGQETP